MRLVLEGYRWLYSPRIREGAFSETGLPAYLILGNSEGISRAKAIDHITIKYRADVLSACNKLALRKR